MAWTGYYGGAIGDMLLQWEQIGIFSYVLPFLLIFSLVFAILMRLNIFKNEKNNTINAIIALVVGLMALQFDFVPIFFSEVFPRIGIAMSIILAILVVAGLFMDPENKAMMVGLMVFSLLVVAVIIYQSFGAFGLSTGYWISAYWPQLLSFGFFLAIIIAVIASSRPTNQTPTVGSVLAKTLRQ